MRKAKIKITIDGSQMNIKLNNCSALNEVVSTVTLMQNIAERLDITSDEAFELVKEAMEVNEEKNEEKAFVLIARIHDLENKVSE